MRKPHSTSVIDSLPQNQRDAIEAWLFEENISYLAAAKRAWDDFGVRVSHTACYAFYQRQAQKRMLDRIAASRQNANLVVDKFKENPADMYQALLDMAGQIAFDKAFQSGKELDAETIYNFTKLVMHGKKQAMESESLKLQRDKFEFDAAKAALKHLPSLRSIAGNSNLNQQEKLNQIRLKLFGVTPE